MKRTLWMLALALLATTPCVMRASDTLQVDERRRLEAECQQLEAERRAEEEAEKRRPRFYREPDTEPNKASDPIDRCRRQLLEAERRAAEQAALFEQAGALERQGKGLEAVRAYVRAARAGSGKAALRLAEIYDKGLLGISRDYAESLKWYSAARALGEEAPPPAGSAPAPPETEEAKRRAAAERAAQEKAARAAKEAAEEERKRREDVPPPKR